MIILGNNIEELKSYPDNYFDAVVTDPPYGLGKEPDACELMRNWVDKGYHEIKGKGFMGKSWDAFVPQPIFWKEVFRVLKHGGHVLSFFGTRTYDWGVMAMRFAGFEIRDSIYWHYGNGFPKSHNISKANEDAKEWEGWGSALKPASEPIVLARKPLQKGLSISENVLKWGTGVINIDGCRISTAENLNGGAYSGGERSEGDWKENSGFKNDKLQEYSQPSGRFPANVILTHHEECQCKGLKKVKTGRDIEEKGSGGIWDKSSGLPVGRQYGDENGEDDIEDWECHEDCPIRIMDTQSGLLKSGKAEIGTGREGNFTNGIYGAKASKIASCYADSGGASRFFYCAKSSKSERNRGLSGQNIHPTVKPVKLMQYLVRLVTPPNGKVLDPFCGSGTTGIACKLEGFDFIGIEQEPEYVGIANSRIKNWDSSEEEWDSPETSEFPTEPKKPTVIQQKLFDE